MKDENVLVVLYSTSSVSAVGYESTGKCMLETCRFKGRVGWVLCEFCIAEAGLLGMTGASLVRTGPTRSLRVRSPFSCVLSTS